MTRILSTFRRTKPMKGKYNSWILAALMIIAATIFPFLAMAQDPGPCPDCPIDGGIMILLVIGLLYGLMKYRHARKSLKGI